MLIQTVKAPRLTGRCSPQYTHISKEDFHVVYHNVTGGHRATTDGQVPFCLFTDPESARVAVSFCLLKRDVVRVMQITKHREPAP
jgi:pyruvate/2-oxoglutarate dehydrogenase complex dihydrolipoamide dehydrogenase (E3) component